MSKGETEFVDKLMRSENNKGVRNVIIAELVLSVIWGALGQAIGSGNLMAVINIVFLLISILLASALVSFLNFYFSKFVSFVVSLLIWALIFVVMRSLF